MGPPLYVRSVVNRNIIMWCVTVLGATVQNLDVIATWHLGLVHVLCLKCWYVLSTTPVTIY
jgi:hypothetical protein